MPHRGVGPLDVGRAGPQHRPIDENRFGVIALTESLCNNQDPFSEEEKQWIKDFVRSRNMDVDLSKIDTLKDTSYIPHIISSAAAAADALFYTGFESVSPATIDEYLAKTVSNYRDEAEQGNYHELGSLSELREALKDLPLEGAPHIRLSDIERKDWFTVINPEGARMIGHYSLIDIYGIEFLTLLFANGTIG